jgi:hypothetical protein
MPPVPVAQVEPAAQQYEPPPLLGAQYCGLDGSAQPIRGGGVVLAQVTLPIGSVWQALPAGQQNCPDPDEHVTEFAGSVHGLTQVAMPLPSVPQG